MDSCMLKACLVLPWKKSVARRGKAASDHMGEEIAEEIVIDRNGGEVLGHKTSKTKLSIKEPAGNRGSRRGRRANQTCLSKDQDLISEPTSRLTRSMRHSLKEQCQNRSNVPEVVSKKPNFCDRSDGSRGERVMLDTKNAVPGFCICYKEKCQQCLSEEVTELVLSTI